MEQEYLYYVQGHSRFQFKCGAHLGGQGGQKMTI